MSDLLNLYVCECSEALLISHKTLDERKGSTELLINPMINLPYLIQGIKELCKDDQFGKRIPELEQLGK